MHFYSNHICTSKALLEFRKDIESSVISRLLSKEVLFKRKFARPVVLLKLFSFLLLILCMSNMFERFVFLLVREPTSIFSWNRLQTVLGYILVHRKVPCVRMENYLKLFCI